jgi:hypothetical protein
MPLFATILEENIPTFFLKELSLYIIFKTATEIKPKKI